jgi:hypothetical protein
MEPRGQAGRRRATLMHDALIFLANVLLLALVLVGMALLLCQR